MTEYPCCCCGQTDALTNTGGLFCHACSDNASDMQKDLLFYDFLHRRILLEKGFEEWEAAA